MNRPMIFAALLALSSLGRPVAAQVETAQPAPASANASATASAADLPARPVPFKFVNDQANLLAPADAKRLEGGLRNYADKNGTQVVVVTVPSLGGRTAADYGRALGNAWGLGQRGKNNGVVVLIAKQERKVAIEAGSGLSDRITAEVKQRVIARDFSPSFKQGNYMAGLRPGLSELMKAANPATAPASASPAMASGAAPALGDNGARANANTPTAPLASGEPSRSALPVEPAPSSGPGIGTWLIGALGLGAVLLLAKRLFGNKTAPQAGNVGGNNPNFYPNQPNQPNRPNQPTPNFGAPQGPANYGPGYGQAPPQQGGGMMGGGMGGILATGAAAAAGAYLGNRLGGSGHDAGNNSSTLDNNANAGGGNAGLGAAGLGGAAAGAAGTGAAGDYFASRDGGTADNNAPDYFSDANAADNSSGGGDYFSSDDNSSYDDSSSADTGGGDFGGGSDDSGSF